MNNNSSKRSFVYANFWSRFLARLVDCLIIWNIFILFINIAGFQLGLVFSLLCAFILIPILQLYLTTNYGGSMGMLLTGIAVTNQNGEFISLKRAIFRNYVVFSVSKLLFGIGFIWVFIDEKNRTWHDLAADTIVIKKNRYGPLTAIIALLLFTSVLGIQISKTISDYIPVVQNIYQEARDEIKNQTLPDQFDMVEDYEVEIDSQKFDNI